MTEPAYKPEDVLSDIVRAWWHPTNWETFGREVGAILTQSGLATRRPEEFQSGNVRS